MFLNVKLKRHILTYQLSNFESGFMGLIYFGGLKSPNSDFSQSVWIFSSFFTPLNVDWISLDLYTKYVDGYDLRYFSAFSVILKINQLIYKHGTDVIVQKK